MASTNTQLAPAATATAFQPAFKRVSQGEDRHADIFAAIATICGKQISDIRTQAEALGVPKAGPYYPYVTEEVLIAKLFAHFGWVSTVWKECTEFKELPDIAIVGVDADHDYEVSRYVVLHRVKTGTDGKTVQYAIDPYMHADARLHIRTDLKGLEPSWYIGVTAMNKTAGK
jgi:hypothetical protein